MRRKLIRSMIGWLSACLLLTLSPCLVVSRGAFDDVIDSPMYKLPDLPVPPVEIVFPEEAKGLWLKALERPEAEMRCKAADAIALAYRRDVKGLDKTIAPLIAAMEQKDQHAAVRLAVARALVTLEAKETAQTLFEQANSGGRDLRDLVEPALARWDYKPARATWLARLEDPKVSQRSLMLAMQGLAAVREERAADRLHELVMTDRTAGSVRLEAARALGRLREEGLDKDAEELAADVSANSVAARLAAVSLLRRHRSKEAVRILEGLMGDKEASVAAPAVARLLEIDTELVIPAVERLLAHPDPNVRLLAVEALFRKPTEKHIHLLGERLDDVHLEVRRKARRHLGQLAAKTALRDPVIVEASKMLETHRWRGLEQATILLTLLDHKPAARRLVALLSFERAEVRITAAWGLRKLDVAETLDDVVTHVDGELKRVLGGMGPPGPGIRFEISDHELSQLNQFLGQRKHAKADEVLRRFIPHRGDRPMTECRAAAMWALGMIHEGKKPDDELAISLEARLNDTRSIPPEEAAVRRMCAIALGRMRAEKTMESLRKYYPEGEPNFDPINNASGWAIEQITGEAVPPPKTVKRVLSDWFLVPGQ